MFPRFRHKRTFEADLVPFDRKGVGWDQTYSTIKPACLDRLFLRFCKENDLEIIGTTCNWDRYKITIRGFKEKIMKFHYFMIENALDFHYNMVKGLS